MIEVKKVSYAFPQKELYKDITFTIEDGQHCAFIGSSGCGKSTLVDMIMDREKYLYDGKIEIDETYRIGYISQFYEVDRDTDITVFDYVAEVFTTKHKEMEDICLAMETAEDLEPLLEAYQNALDAFDAIDGNDYENAILKRLGQADLLAHKDQRMADLSGGEFKLIQVIKEMLLHPQLLIMDEPDAFLDFENLNALKSLINNHKETLLVITHNRYLLNHCFNKIIHLENKQLQEYDGRFIDYNFELLQTKIDTLEASIEDTEEIARNEKLIGKLRFIATYNTEASRGKALKARVKIQERLMARRTKAPFVFIQQPDVRLHAGVALDDGPAVDVKGFDAAYDDILLEDVNFTIAPGDKVALIGANGTGKTTILRALMQNNHPAIHFHPEAKVSYLSQAHDEVLADDKTIINTFVDLGMDSTRAIRSLIGSYGFSEDYLHQKVSALSGGEKNILQLAMMSVEHGNILLMDEPTSHLDMYAQIALEEAIEKYDGALLMISHDYYSIANCMDYVLIIDNKTVRKMSMRKFRKTIYAKHFDKNYLEIEQKKKAVETKIAFALQRMDFEKARKLSEELEEHIGQL